MALFDSIWRWTCVDGWRWSVWQSPSSWSSEQNSSTWPSSLSQDRGGLRLSKSDTASPADLRVECSLELCSSSLQPPLHSQSLASQHRYGRDRLAGYYSATHSHTTERKPVLWRVYTTTASPFVGLAPAVATLNWNSNIWWTPVLWVQSEQHNHVPPVSTQIWPYTQEFWRNGIWNNTFWPI